MRDPRITRLAEVLVKYSTAVRPGDIVAIAADPAAFPLIEATYEAVLAAGGHPFWQARSEALADLFMERASEEQLRFISPIQEHHVETIDVHIGFWADLNTKSLSAIDPDRQAIHAAARRPISKRFMQRAAEGSLRWVGTLFPTNGAAQDAEMSLRQYEDFVYSAGLLERPDPIAEWKRISEAQKRLCDWLQGKRELHFLAPNGTDLRVGIDGGTWINCDGHENFPDGEVFTGPQDANGTVCYSFPAVHGGREVHDIRLAFKGGRVIEAGATKGEEFLHRMLDLDEGARNLGEIAIGTNYGITRYTKNTLFDEKIGGTFHAAVGAGYPESGNHNESGLHWDMVCDLRTGGAIAADGEVFHRDGRFLRDGWPGTGPS